MTFQFLHRIPLNAFIDYDLEAEEFFQFLHRIPLNMLSSYIASRVRAFNSFTGFHRSPVPTPDLKGNSLSIPSPDSTSAVSAQAIRVRWIHLSIPSPDSTGVHDRRRKQDAREALSIPSPDSTKENGLRLKREHRVRLSIPSPDSTLVKFRLYVNGQLKGAFNSFTGFHEHRSVSRVGRHHIILSIPSPDST